MVNSYNEILNDTLCLEYLFEIKRNTQNIETKSVISSFIFLIMPIMYSEIPTFLHKEGILDKQDFYNPPYQNISHNWRHRVLKSTIHSRTMKILTEEMGIDFNAKVYDLNIIMSNEELLAFNFSMFKQNKEYDDYYWSSLAFLNQDIITGVLKGLSFEIDSSLIIQKLKDKVLASKENIGNMLNPARYSYSVFKLFGGADIDEADKLLVLYRFELVKNLILISRNIEDFSLTCSVNQKNFFNLNFSRFVLKMKAVVIHILGKDFLELNTDFSQRIKEQLLCAEITDDFYRLNGKIRNNLHYSHIESFTCEQEDFIRKKQDAYLSILLENFNSVCSINLDDEVISMTKFLEQCIQKGYTSDYIHEHYYKLYSSFLEDSEI